MPSDLSSPHANVLCAECMRANADNDRNFCEKMMQDGKCGLVP